MPSTSDPRSLATRLASLLALCVAAATVQAQPSPPAAVEEPVDHGAVAGVGVVGQHDIRERCVHGVVVPISERPQDRLTRTAVRGGREERQHG